MDNFINLAKTGYEAYSKSRTYMRSYLQLDADRCVEEHVNQTGGQQYNSPSHQGGGYQGVTTPPR